MRKLFSNFRTPGKVTIEIDPSDSYHKALQEKKKQPKSITVDDPHDQFSVDGKAQTFILFNNDDPISGKVVVEPEKTFDHSGIKIELIGEIVLYFETKQTSQFTALCKEIAPAGSINEKKEYEFHFKNVEKEFESYRGINVDLRYYLRVTVTRSVFSIVKEQEFWVQCCQGSPEGYDPGINMEVGLEGIVLLSINYSSIWHDLRTGCIEGKLKFYLVNVKIDKAEVSLIKREKAGQGEYAVTEQEVLKKFEVIDGTPAKDEVVPVRLYLSSIDAWKLIPTCTQVNNKFSVQYFIHLALCDTKGRRFFKQKELNLWRSNVNSTYHKEEF